MSVRKILVALAFSATAGHAAPANHAGQVVMPRQEFLRGIDGAKALSRREPPRLLSSEPPRAFSLAAWQTPIKNQDGRGTCWAFAAVGALEAAYKRTYGIDLDLSEQYVFHIEKAGELYSDYVTSAVPHENNSSYWGFQGNSGILEQMERFGVPTEADAPYEGQAAMDARRLATPAAGAVDWSSTQEQLDAFEFSEQHIPAMARERAKYRVVRAEAVGAGDTTALERVISGGHEVVADFDLKWGYRLYCDCYVYDDTASGGGHVMLLVGYDRNADVFIAKNSWGETSHLRLSYDFVRRAMSWGHYIAEIAPPSAPADAKARWLGRWKMDHDGWKGDLVIRRFTDFRNPDPNAATKVGTYYRDGKAYDVNGSFTNDGRTLVYHVADSTGRKTPGSATGQRFEAHIMGREYGKAGGTTEWSGVPFGVRLSRWELPAAPATGAFNIARWISAFAMSHDGWKGRLTLSDYSYVTPGSAGPYWELRGTYTPQGGAPIAVTGRANADRPHVLSLTIPFSADNKQPFKLHYHTRELGAFSGVTWWGGAPFGVVGE